MGTGRHRHPLSCPLRQPPPLASWKGCPCSSLFFQKKRYKKGKCTLKLLHDLGLILIKSRGLHGEKQNPSADLLCVVVVFSAVPWEKQWSSDLRADLAKTDQGRTGSWALNKDNNLELSLLRDQDLMQGAGACESPWAWVVKGVPLTSPPGWGPCCWGCRGAGKTRKSHRCRRSSPGSQILKRRPAGEKEKGPEVRTEPRSG